jgi:hypothetical protein
MRSTFALYSRNSSFPAICVHVWALGHEQGLWGISGLLQGASSQSKLLTGEVVHEKQGKQK